MIGPALKKRDNSVMLHPGKGVHMTAQNTCVKNIQLLKFRVVAWLRINQIFNM